MALPKESGDVDRRRDSVAIKARYDGGGLRLRGLSSHCDYLLYDFLMIALFERAAGCSKPHIVGGHIPLSGVVLASHPAMIHDRFAFRK